MFYDSRKTQQEQSGAKKKEKGTSVS